MLLLFAVDSVDRTAKRFRTVKGSRFNLGKYDLVIFLQDQVDFAVFCSVIGTNENKPFLLQKQTGEIFTALTKFLVRHAKPLFFKKLLRWIGETPCFSIAAKCAFVG